MNTHNTVSLSLAPEKNFEISSLFKLLANADIVSKFIVLLLLTASVISVAIILKKYLQYSSLVWRMKIFEQNFWGGQSLHQTYSRIKKLPDNPLATIFRVGMDEVNTQNSSEDLQMRSFLLLQSMNLVRNKEVDKLERSLTLLATIGSYTPFIGLFGMIWGVINSFQSISSAKHVSISVVAPGLSEALFITAIGIAVALPAAIFYNILSNKLNIIINRLDDFISEVHVSIIKENI